MWLVLISIKLFRNKRGFTDSSFGQPKFLFTLDTKTLHHLKELKLFCLGFNNLKAQLTISLSLLSRMN